MPSPFRSVTLLACAAAALLASSGALAQEALIRKVLAERIPQLQKIDEVRATPIPGLYEVRYDGSELLYTDAKGEFLIQGAIIETKTGANLTEERQDKLSAVNFAALPLKDAVQLKQGDGSRKLAVFVDPNCGYCKRFERDLAALKNVTIYAFIMPILGPDSTVKARDIWCARDNGHVWRTWMIDGTLPPKAKGPCDSSALERNVAFGQKYRIQGTPAVFFEDGTRKAGAIPGPMVEKLLVAAAKKG
jgi:thiol:disulfide interchange protein DsbC